MTASGDLDLTCLVVGHQISICIDDFVVIHSFDIVTRRGQRQLLINHQLMTIIIGWLTGLEYGTRIDLTMRKMSEMGHPVRLLYRCTFYFNETIAGGNSPFLDWMDGHE